MTAARLRRVRRELQLQDRRLNPTASRSRSRNHRSRSPKYATRSLKRALREIARLQCDPALKIPRSRRQRGFWRRTEALPRAPANLFLLLSFLAGAGSPKRSGAQPRGGRVRGASARRALETGQGGRHVPRELVLARFGGRRLLGVQGAKALSSPLGGLDVREALPADQSGPARTPRDYP